ncbi:hypothetical protein [Methylobacterium soli]|uniref:Uncharacterized protein n=1 Tax=Methylobacterium soli TaxID=553447 RepID=A0A6L3STS2_9HYPH|nr:hypothetical protein [Methylobacterium soli]KAB1072379.1 hypothetical protein F6X53_28250 [Methylobacterium soli]GJE41418.1 hypothetical protein AEGHOMDF_0584 [Methylobacterium soli]
MVARPLLKRLARLEALHVTNRPGIEDEETSGLKEVLLVLIAYHLGALQRDEALEPALARAFEWEIAHEIDCEPQSGFHHHPKFNERFNDALERLLARRKVGFADPCTEVEHALMELFRCLPEWCRAHPTLRGFELDYGSAAEKIQSDDQGRPTEVVGVARDPVDIIRSHLYCAIRWNLFGNDLADLIHASDPTYASRWSWSVPPITRDMSPIEAFELYQAALKEEPLKRRPRR